jgi:hypothetical protein
MAIFPPHDYSGDLEQIIDGFPNDATILGLAACCLYAADRYGRALEVLGDAIDLRPDSPELRWQRASYRSRMNMRPGAVEDLLTLLDVRSPHRSANPHTSEEGFPESLSLDDWSADWRFDLPKEFRKPEPAKLSLSDYSDPLLHLRGIDPYVASAFWQLCQLSPDRLEEVKRKPAVAALSPEDQKRLFAGPLSPRQPDDPHALIRKHKWDEVVKLLRPRLEQSDSWRIDDALCLFIAYWGLGREAELQECGKKLMGCARCSTLAGRVETILNDQSAEGEKLMARFHALGHHAARAALLQMMALVSWRTGASREVAERILDFIEEKAPAPERPFFSYWGFRRVSWNRFKEDCCLLRQMFRGATVRPPFLGKEPAHR